MNVSENYAERGDIFKVKPIELDGIEGSRILTYSRYLTHGYRFIEGMLEPLLMVKHRLCEAFLMDLSPPTSLILSLL